MESKWGTDVHLFSSEFLQRETIDGQVIGVVEEGNTLIWGPRPRGLVERLYGPKGGLPSVPQSDSAVLQDSAGVSVAQIATSEWPQYGVLHPFTSLDLCMVGDKFTGCAAFSNNVLQSVNKLFLSLHH